MARVEVITGADRRRRWSDDQKQAIVARALRRERGAWCCGAWVRAGLISAPEGSSVAAELPADAEPVIEVE